MNERGVLGALVAVTFGIAAGERAGPGAAAGALFVGVLALLASWFVSGRVRLVVAMVALALIGAAQMQRALDGVTRSPLTDAIERRAPVTLSGVLVDDPQSGRFDTDAYVRVAAGGTHRTLFA